MSGGWAAGLIKSLARPGGNPQAHVIALLVNPNSKGAETQIQDVQDVVQAKGLQLPILKAGADGRFRNRLGLTRRTMPAGSSLVAIRSSTPGAKRSWRWRREPPFRQSMPQTSESVCYEKNNPKSGS